MIFQNNANLFHGTNANSLPNILKYGMNSVDKSSQENISVLTGEKWSRVDGHRNFISFTDDVGIALKYSSLTPDKAKEDNLFSFGALLGISKDVLSRIRKCEIHSDLPELAIKDHLDLEELKFIAVPEAQVDFVKKLVGNQQISVISANFYDQFYNCQNKPQMIDYLSKLLEHSKETEINTVPPVFSKQDMQQVSGNRKMSKIKSVYTMMKDIIKGKEKNYGEYSKD